ncbi:hypothetical protein [Microbulbifer agarilyticus]|uniref:hypothetical protein n=1 Tax=Microbulbifer agarilyticus TaxID=260552 RepID=UPI001CD7EF3E|nr:hypothetical protein [Microbulbifer agarilyticus]MCA0895147.1 hypothetical protein [Microbulbifer agarilyticus]
MKKVIAFFSLCVFPLASLAIECTVKGDTALWVMAYCMALHETDDDANPSVNSCFINLRSTMDKNVKESCQKNRDLKVGICLLNQSYGLSSGGLDSCLSSNNIPTVVANGGV